MQEVIQSQDDLMRLVWRKSRNVCDIYARLKCSRDHRGELPRGREGYPCPVKWPPETHVNRLRNVRLERGEYDAVMRRFDGPDTLHYLDLPPPRLQNPDRERINTALPGAIKQTAMQMRGSVVISSNDHPAVWNTFCRKPSPFACYVIKKSGIAARHREESPSKRLLVAVKP
jgi:hypothetical protein